MHTEQSSVVIKFTIILFYNYFCHLCCICFNTQIFLKCQTKFYFTFWCHVAQSFLGSLFNNIHEKNSPLCLVKSSAVFLKQCRKELIQCKKRKQTKHSDWSMIREPHRWPIKSFVLKSSARPGWRNFSLIAWYTLVPSAQPSRNFFMYIINK